MGFFNDEKEKTSGMKIDNDDLLETAAYLLKIQAKVNPGSLSMINNSQTLVDEYLKVVRTLKAALRNEKE